MHGARPRGDSAFPDPTAAPPCTPLPSVEELWGKPSTRATTCCAQPPARLTWPLVSPCCWMRPVSPQPATAKEKVNRPQSPLYCKLGLRAVDNTLDTGKSLGRGRDGARGVQERVLGQRRGAQGEGLGQRCWNASQDQNSRALKGLRPIHGKPDSWRKGERDLRPLRCNQRGEPKAGVGWAGGDRVGLSGRSPPLPRSSHPAGKPRHLGRS